MYGEEHKSKGLDLEEIEYEDIAEELEDEDLEEIEYVDFEDETEYADFQDADAESDYLEIIEFESKEEDVDFEPEEPKKKGKQHKKEPYEAYTDDEQKTSAIYIVFIALTALGVIAVLVVFGLWFYKESDGGEPGVALIHQYTVTESGKIGQNVAQTDIRLQEERKAAEEAARLEAEAAAKAEEEAKKDLGMVFSAVQETVTAKDATNLRDIPSQGEDSTVMLTLQNGQTATRIGVSDKGWSKLEYNGETYYAISNYLTTDLTVKPQEVVPEDDGIKTVFTACNEQVTPKIEVNLRTLPSVTNPDATVIVTLKAGEVVTRTGINTDVGWSRVEYNGQTLYCVSSYVYVVQ